MSDNPLSSPAWSVDPVSYLQQRPAAHKIPAAPRSRYLAMPDGVRLALDVYLPEGARPAAGFSTILIFTPYYRRFALRDDAPAGTECCPNAGAYRDAFVPMGYAVVIVDVRGTGASYGTRDSFRSPAEREDYAAIMDWVVGQDWSNGRLGATGISYVGAACDFAASTGHPALKAIAPISTVWDTYADHFYPGGILLTHLTWGYAEIMEALDQDNRELLKKFSYYADPNLAGPAPVDDDRDGSEVRAAIAEHIANVHMPDFMREFQFRDSSLAYDPEFTSDSFSPHAYSQGIREDVAVLSISGWMDGAYMNGAISRFLSLPRNPRYLLLGPWDHGARANVSPFRGTVVPEFPVLGSILRFFDEHVEGLDAGLAREAPVHYHTMREEGWKSARQWPPNDNDRAFYVCASGRLTESPETSDDITYRVDYGCGTGLDTRYGRLQVRNVQNYYADWQCRPGRYLELRSVPLETDLTMSGHPVVKLFLASDQADACIFVYLEDVGADGMARYVTEGMLRGIHGRLSASSATYVTSWPYRIFTRSEARPLVSGEMYEFEFALLPTSWRFPAGHRIGLSLAGADRDNFAMWPYGRPGRWTIGCGANYPSQLTLPVE